MDVETLRGRASHSSPPRLTGEAPAGLASVHGLALQSGGALRLTSRIGAGTTAEIWLPRAAVDAEASAAPALPAGDSAPLKLRVLLVDDDGLIAMSTKAVLEDLGHAVRTAQSGKKALELLAVDPAVDLVISDHAMPGMTGLELIERIQAQWPRMPVLLATGYADSMGDRRELPRIIKPYSREELAAAIRRVLAAAGADEARSGVT